MNRRNRAGWRATVALAAVSATLAVVAPAEALGGCFDPVDFGAVPNDGGDDRAAFQAAVDAAIAVQGEVCIGPGNWDLTRNPLLGAANIGSIKVVAANGLTIRGAGPATRLRMLGSGNNADWRLIDIRQGSTNVRVFDLYLDGSQRHTTEEQTHLLHLTGPVSGITIERVRFDLPQILGEGGGDCVRLLGEVATPVSGVVMRRLTGLHCDRSFVAVQRGVQQVLLEDSTSLIVGDQPIDFEPTGTGGVADLRIVGSRLGRGPAGQGIYTIAIGKADGVQVASTFVFDGGIHVIDTRDVVLDGVVVTGRPGAPVLHVRKRTERFSTLNSTFLRPAGLPEGVVVLVHHQSGAAPTDVTFDHSVFVQNASGPVFSIESLNSFTLTNSSLEYRGQPGLLTAITGRGVIAPIAQVVVRDNRFEGPTATAMQLARFETNLIGAVEVTGNLASALSQAGVRFEGGLPSVPPVICGNDFGGVPPVVPEMPLSCP
jgi:hypothetical protein